jgi:hypothetical protein
LEVAHALVVVIHRHRKDALRRSWPITYWSRISLISLGDGSSPLTPLAPPVSAAISSRMMSLHSSMHSSQMNTDGPAISLRTSCWLLPQNEQYNSFSPLVFLSAITSFSLYLFS